MKRIVLLFTAFFILQNITAQDIGVWQLSNTSGVYGTLFNPAQLANSRYQWQVNLLTFNANTGNNAVHNSYIPGSKIGLNLKDNRLGVQANHLIGPSAMVQTARWGTVALTTAYRSFQGASGDNLVTLLNDETTTATSIDGAYLVNGFKSVALSYAYPIHYKAHSLNLGITIKKFTPYALSDLGSSKSGFSLLTNQFGESFSIGNLLSAKGGSSGLEGGFMYEFRPKYVESDYQMDNKLRRDPTTNGYLARFGISVVNEGFAKAFNGLTSQNYSSKASLNSIREKDWSGDFTKDVENFGFQPSGGDVTESGIASVNRLNILAEAALGKGGWYATAVYSKFLVKDFPDANASVLAVIPRYEKAGLEFAVPVTYSQPLKQIGLGFHLKLGPFILGAESLNYLFMDNARPPTVYAGFSLSGLAKKIRDRDGDTVSDNKDKCKDVAGLWVFNGCPDTDFDGIEDALDKCPENAGPAATGGCPDADGDGIFDNQDACPNIAGKPEFNGCPDTDNDGIMDSEDDCPTEAGTLENGGCPDTDGDGIIDSQDKCPKEAGPKENQGCPVKK